MAFLVKKWHFLGESGIFSAKMALFGEKMAFSVKKWHFLVKKWHFQRKNGIFSEKMAISVKIAFFFWGGEIYLS